MFYASLMFMMNELLNFAIPCTPLNLIMPGKGSEAVRDHQLQDHLNAQTGPAILLYGT